jgi:5-methylcytosine-specific restriction endonuclease McrA
MGATGPKPNRKKHSSKKKNKFKSPSKFNHIKVENRLKFLISHLKENCKNVPDNVRDGRRLAFNQTKEKIFPLTSGIRCYLCGLEADIRHHVVPLKKGGTNKINNIVPLCNPCHCKVHPHMRKGFKKIPNPPKRSPLGKPLKMIVVILPKVNS